MNKKIYFVLSLVLYLGYSIQTYALPPREELEQFGYLMGTFEGIQCIQKESFRRKYKIEQEEIYQRLESIARTILPEKEFRNYAQLGASSVQSLNPSPTLSLENLGSKVISALRNSSTPIDYSWQLQEYLHSQIFGIVYTLGRWQQEKKIHSEYKYYFEFLKNISPHHHNVLQDKYKKGQLTAHFLHLKEEQGVEQKRHLGIFTYEEELNKTCLPIFFELTRLYYALNKYFPKFASKL